jgi:P2-related tail formation protein
MKTFKLAVLTWCLCVLAGFIGFIDWSHAQNEPSPSDNMKTFSTTDQTGFKEGRYRGKVVRVDGTDVVITTKEGEEISLHRDETTKTAGKIKKGDMIEVHVNDQHHILSMKPFSQSETSKTNAGTKK